jgi:tetratricopeptide (TPR) repeat protein
MQCRQRIIVTVALWMGLVFVIEPFAQSRVDSAAVQPQPNSAGGRTVHAVVCDPGEDSRKADRLLASGRYSQAIAAFEHIKQCCPFDWTVREKLIDAYFKSNSRKLAREEAEQSAKAASVEGKIRFARLLNINGDSVGAVSILGPLVSAGPVPAEVHGELGIALLGDGQYEASVRELGTAVQLDGESMRYSLELARALLSWGNYPTSLAFLDAIQDRFAADPGYLYERAWAYYGLHRMTDAVETLKAVLEKRPQWDLAQFSLGNAYWMQGDVVKAEKQYRTAISLNSGNASYYIALGRLLREIGDNNPETISALSRGLTLEPHNIQAEFELASAYKSQAEYGKAKSLLEDVIARRPDMVDAHRILGLIYYKLSARTDGARQMALAADLEEKARQQAAMGNPSPEPVEKVSYK